MQGKKISVVIPVYNGADNLHELTDRLVKVLSLQTNAFEIILVDDFSKDNSWSLIVQLKQQYPAHIKGVKMSRNYGQHMAIFCGLSLSSGDLVFTMDDDLQHPPEEIPKLLAKYNETGADVVYGLYDTTYGHGRTRGMASNFVKRTSTYFSENTLGNGSSFRALTRKLVDKLILHPQQFVFIDEIIYWYTTDVTGVPVEHHQRKVGKSNYGYYRLVKLYLHVVLHFTALPLQLMIWGGVILSIFSFLMGVYFILKKMLFNVPVEGYTSLMVTIMFSTSLMLICFGILGKYVHQIYQSQNGKPPYTIRQVI